MDGDLVVLFYRWIVLRPMIMLQEKRVEFAKKIKKIGLDKVVGLTGILAGVDLYGLLLPGPP